jgi:hypothetical protein
LIDRDLSLNNHLHRDRTTVVEDSTHSRARGQSLAEVQHPQVTQQKLRLPQKLRHPLNLRQALPASPLLLQENQL